MLDVFYEWDRGGVPVDPLGWDPQDFKCFLQGTKEGMWKPVLESVFEL
jgi:hypothetical protein